MIELIVCSNGVILASAGRQSLRKPFAAVGAIWTWVQNGGEGVFTAGVGAPWASQSVGGGAHKGVYGP